MMIDESHFICPTEELRAEPIYSSSPAELHCPLVFSSPHSGRLYPECFFEKTSLPLKDIRTSEDAYVDALVDSVEDMQLPFIKALFPRIFVDVNREPYELDPLMFREALPDNTNKTSLRVVSGLGTVAKVTGNQKIIYNRLLDVPTVMRRIDTFYKPYHEKLSALLRRSMVLFGRVVLIDCHSMPSRLHAGQPRSRPDFVLGNRYGQSCHPDLTDKVMALLKQQGYTVRMNKPYAGGFITEHYGKPEQNLHTLQIEINRDLYMNETTLEIHEGFQSLSDNLQRLFAELAELYRENGTRFSSLAMAAE
jgi:N-formylglutamate amidohydrolase